ARFAGASPDPRPVVLHARVVTRGFSGAERRRAIHPRVRRVARPDASAGGEVLLGVSWCSLVAGRKRPRRASRKRFSLSLDEADYSRLRAIAKQHKPPLTLQYVVNYAIQRLLIEADDPQLRLELGSPLGRRRGGG